MTKLVEEHRMDEKLQKIEQLYDLAPQTAIQRAHDKWDDELGQFMRHSEKKCTKVKSCDIAYSPTVGQWLKRRAILKWLLRWHDGKVPDTRNLCRAARRANIKDPLPLSKSEVQDRLHSCLEHLFELKSEAPALRKKHLQWRLRIARQNEDEEATTEILRIVKNEARRHRQRSINRVVRDMRGRSVLSVQETVDGNEETHTKQEAVEDACGQHLGSRFSLGKRAPLSASALRDEIGNLSDTEAARKILSNDYEFSDNWDAATVDLLRESAKLRLECDDIPTTHSDVTIDEFSTFWRTCKEKTSSSKSG